HEIAGAVVSTTVTPPVACDIAPRGSVTVRRTDVEPSGYGPGGDWTMDSGSPSASDDPSSIDAGEGQVDGLAATVTFLAFATGTALGGEQFPKHAPDTSSE